MNALNERDRKAVACLCIALFLATLIPFLPVLSNGFVSFDDDLYITANSVVKQGLTWDGVSWAFTHGYANNWHPLTWLSHMLDCQLFGVAPRGHHLVNLLLHAVNSALLLYVLVRFTGCVWRSLFVALLFAVHPMHVESVAWASERKDTVSAFFWVLTMLAYIRHAERPSRTRYGCVMLCFMLGLLAKQMLVTLPLILLLLDYWPLKRFEPAAALAATGTGDGFGGSWRMRAKGLVLEKIPLLFVAGMAALGAYTVQSQSGTVKSFAAFSVSARLANVITSYVSYIGQAIWPARLAVFYPFREPRLLPAACALVLLAVVSLWAVLQRRVRGYFFLGWFWYLVSLLPVIGIIQIGVQARADRYTYIPFIGLFVAITWAVSDALATRRWGGGIRAAAAIPIVLVLSVLTWHQTGYWRDSLTLYEHAAEVVPDNYWAYYNVGVQLDEQGKQSRAIEFYRAASRAKADFPESEYNLAVDLAKAGADAEARDHYLKVLRLMPDHAKAWSNLAALQAEAGQVAEASASYRRALQIDADLPEAHAGLGVILEAGGQFQEAARHYRAALRASPGWDFARSHLNALERGQRAEAGDSSR